MRPGTERGGRRELSVRADSTDMVGWWRSLIGKPGVSVNARVTEAFVTAGAYAGERARLGDLAAAGDPAVDAVRWDFEHDADWRPPPGRMTGPDLREACRRAAP
jgi:hypothetical protein